MSSTPCYIKYFSIQAFLLLGFSGGASGKEPASIAGVTGDNGLIRGSGRPPGEGNGNPVSHSCLENPMGRGAWQSTVLSVAESRTRLK